MHRDYSTEWLALIVGLLATVGLLASCSVNSAITAAQVTYYHDDAHRVSCWVITNVGISCLADPAK